MVAALKEQEGIHGKRYITTLDITLNLSFPCRFLLLLLLSRSKTSRMHRGQSVPIMRTSKTAGSIL